MTKVTKYVLWAVAAAVIIKAASVGNGSGAVSLIFAGIFVWLAWRAFVFLSLLLRPVREKIRPYVDPVNQHVDATLRHSGLGVVADAGAGLQSGLDRAVDATQKGIDARR